MLMGGQAMDRYVKLFLNGLIKNGLILGISVSIILYLFTDSIITSIYLFGLIIGIVNFSLSGFILDKNINSKKTTKKILFPITYIIRIGIIALIGLVFSNKLSTLLAYLAGFISQFPILIFTWKGIKKGSE